MPLLTTVEAAIKLGVGVELIEYFTKMCPKHGEDKKLAGSVVEGRLLIEEQALIAY